MRLNRKTLVLIIVLLVVLFGAAAVLNAPDDTSVDADATSVQVALFPEVNADDITTLTITQATEVQPSPEATAEADSDDDGVTTSTVVFVRDEEAGWTLDSSDLEAANGLEQAEIDSVLTTLASLQSSDQFTRDDLAPFGLDGTGNTIAFEVGNTSYTLRVGSRNPQSTRFYAQLGDDETIYVVSNPAQIDTLLGFATQLPVVQVPTPTAMPTLVLPGGLYTGVLQTNFLRFEMTDNVSGETLAFSRPDVDSEWILEEAPEGIEGVPVQTDIAVLVTSWVSLQGVDGLPAENLDSLGLEDPAYTVVGERTDGGTNTLRIGDQDPTGTRYYALVDEFDQVAVVPADEMDVFLSRFEDPPIEPEIGPNVPESTDEAEAEATDNDSAPSTDADATAESEPDGSD